MGVDEEEEAAVEEVEEAVAAAGAVERRRRGTRARWGGGGACVFMSTATSSRPAARMVVPVSTRSTMPSARPARARIRLRGSSAGRASACEPRGARAESAHGGAQQRGEPRPHAASTDPEMTLILVGWPAGGAVGAGARVGRGGRGAGACQRGARAREVPRRGVRKRCGVRACACGHTGCGEEASGAGWRLDTALDDVWPSAVRAQHPAFVREAGLWRGEPVKGARVHTAAHRSRAAQRTSWRAPGTM